MYELVSSLPMYLSTTDEGQVKFVFAQIDSIKQRLHVKLAVYVRGSANEETMLRKRRFQR